jgi:fatty acid desaturase
MKRDTTAANAAIHEVEVELELERQQKSEYGELKRRVREAGLLKPQPWYYTYKIITVLGMLAIGVAVALIIHNPWLLLLDAVFLGFVSTQQGLLAHDVAHWQAFHGRRANQIANLCFGNLLLGVSYTWWTTKHNQHHATPNHLEDDPDINFPMLVFATEQIAAKARWLRPLISVQAFAFLLLLPFQSLNVRYHSIKHLFGPKARVPYLQGTAIGIHLGLYFLLLWYIGWPLAVAFFVVHQATFGLYNGSVFASNHKGMAIVKPGERLGFLREQVLTTRNVKGQPLVDFWTGGLNYQIEHHLFPNMPRNRLKEAQVLVRAFCAEYEIEYYETGLIRSYGEILAHLHRMSAPLRHSGALGLPAGVD